MAKRRRKQGNAAQLKPSAGSWQPSYWMIVAAILFFFSAGLVVKMVFAPINWWPPTSGVPAAGAANFSWSIAPVTCRAELKKKRILSVTTFDAG